MTTLMSSLNDRGYLAYDSMLPSTPVKRKLLFSELREENLQQFCFEAADTIADNIRVASALPDSPFFKIHMKTCLENICRIYARENMRSAICLSLLVHASKCTDECSVNLFVVLVKCSHKNKSFQIDVQPPACFEEAKRFLYAPCLSAILLQNLRGLDVEALHDIKFIFVDFPESNIRGWCGPSLVVVNVYALQETFHLRHVVPLVILLGNEMRRALERKYAGNDHNYSTSDMATEKKNPAFAVESRDGFELAAVGRKFSYNITSLEEEQNEMLDEIKTSFIAGKAPALDAAQLMRIGFLKAELSELDFDYDFKARERDFM
jgi:hypothetical protein